VIQIQRDRARRFGVASDELLDQSLGQSVDVAASHGALQTREGGTAGQRLLGIERYPPGCQLEQRVMTQGVGVVAVLIAAGHLKDALRQQIAQRVGDVTRIAGIGNGPGQAIDQADATIDGAQHQGARVRGHLTGAEIGANREASSGREAELFRGKIQDWASSCRHFLRTGF